MLDMVDILKGAGELINRLIIEEFNLQGHRLTGAFEESFRTEITRTARIDKLSGFAASYGLIVNQGLQPEQVSEKMLPGLVTYFIKRGVDPKDAVRAAKATLNKWKVEGMNTQASKRFSKTGARKNFIEAAFIGNNTVIDEYMTGLMDFGIEEKYRETKNETI